MAKPTLYMPESTYFQSFYYDNLIPQIYQEITSHYEGDLKKGINVSFPVLRLRDDGGKEASVQLRTVLIGQLQEVRITI